MLRFPRSAESRRSQRLLPVPANVFPFICHRGAWPGHDCGLAAAHMPNGMTYGCNTAGGLSIGSDLNCDPPVSFPAKHPLRCWPRTLTRSGLRAISRRLLRLTTAPQVLSAFGGFARHRLGPSSPSGCASEIHQHSLSPGRSSRPAGKAQEPKLCWPRVTLVPGVAFTRYGAGCIRQVPPDCSAPAGACCGPTFSLP